MKSNTSKTFLILGGTGFIGSALLSNLKGQIISVSRSKKSDVENKFPHVKFVYKTIDKITQNDLKNIDTVYYCASTTDNFGILENPYEDIDVNLNQLISFLETVKKLQKKPKIMYLSTFFVYGNYYDANKKRVKESTPTDPLSLYATTKLCAESILKLYSRMYQIPYVICRLSNIYGPGDKALHKKGVLNYFIGLALKHKKIILYDGGSFVRDYLYIDDLISALFKIENKVVNETVLLASGTSLRLLKIVKYICTLTNSNSKIESISSPPFHQSVGVNSFKADNSKLIRLGWVPKIGYKEGLRKIIKSMS